MAQSHIVNRYPHSEGNILLASYDPLFLGVEPCVGFGDMQWQQVSSRRIGSNNRRAGKSADIVGPACASWRGALGVCSKCPHPRALVSREAGRKPDIM